MTQKVRLVILWHFHQPPYLDPVNNEVRMPWTWLHALRDYVDMPVLACSKKARVCFNVVPSLILQLQDLVSGRVQDRFLQVFLTKAEALTDAQKTFLVENFFELHRETMVVPYPRYQELEQKTRPSNGHRHRRWKVLSVEDLRDLQLWYFLAWSGRQLRKDPVVQALLEKGRGFSEEDKAAFHRQALAFVATYSKVYSGCFRPGGSELSVSPMYHPILPLLTSSDAATQARQGTALPVEHFSYPMDAEQQVALGRDYVRSTLGIESCGMWPPEGSISPRVLSMLSASGLRWIATDGDLLSKSLGRAAAADELYRPWRVGDLNIFFRDHRLSDLIGFVYSKWQPEKAAQHFVEQVVKAADACSHNTEPIVTVALDGENAWEFYEHGGYEFLDKLYDTLLQCGRIELCTPSIILEQARGEVWELSNPPTGSWISGDFSTWIGEPVKNRAWDILTAARRTVDEWCRGSKERGNGKDLGKLMDLVYRAEASDWFWWFGEGHSSKYDPEFDFLFRQNIRAIYGFMGVEAPPDLDVPLGKKSEEKVWINYPTRLISPRISGRRDNFYKWQGCGHAALEHGQIHQSCPFVVGLSFGFDETNFYLKLDGRERFANLFSAGNSLGLRIIRPGGMNLVVRVQDGAAALFHEDGRKVEDAHVAVDTVLELSVALKALCVDVPRCELEFCVRVLDGDMELERFPYNKTVSFKVKGPELDVENWVV